MPPKTRRQILKASNAQKPPLPPKQTPKQQHKESFDPYGPGPKDWVPSDVEIKLVKKLQELALQKQLQAEEERRLQREMQKNIEKGLKIREEMTKRIKEMKEERMLMLVGGRQRA